MSEHTKGKWKKSDRRHYIHNANDEIIIACFGDDDELSWNEKQANLDFAIKACNMHEELLDMLETIILVCGRGISQNMKNEIRDLIQKATGGKENK